MKTSELRTLIREEIQKILSESDNNIYTKFLKDPENPTGRAKQIITKFLNQHGDDDSMFVVDRFIRQNKLTPEEGYIIKYITKPGRMDITSGPGGPNLSLNPRFK